MSNKIKLYLDMDGVLSDFQKRYFELFGVKPSDVPRPSEMTDDSPYKNNWKNFCEGSHFATLEPHPGAGLLLQGISRYEKLCDIEILSSTGGNEFHSQVSYDKRRWLDTWRITYKPNLVPGRRKKKEFADGYSILIDDTPDVIDAWKEAGGWGILYEGDVDKTINEVYAIIFVMLFEDNTSNEHILPVTES